MFIGCGFSNSIHIEGYSGLILPDPLSTLCDVPGARLIVGIARVLGGKLDGFNDFSVVFSGDILGNNPTNQYAYDGKTWQGVFERSMYI